MKKLILPILFFTLLFSTAQVMAVKINDEAQRQAQIEQYLKEFVGNSLFYYPNIRSALFNALAKLPDDVFATVTDRRHPLIFVISINSGIARFANATEFVTEKNDPPTFTEGFYLIILGDELNNTTDVEAIEGVILHEIAHDYLQHLRVDQPSCELEREANRLVKEWGYEEIFLKAKAQFGSKSKDDSPCYDSN